VTEFSLTLKRLLAILCLSAGFVAAHAAPEAPAPQASAPAANANDPVMGLLSERGLLKPLEESAKSSALVRSVRDTASDLVMSAMNFLGVPYRLGGNSNDTGFDCSGFTRHIFESSIGLVLPRRADEQANTAALVSVRRDQLKPGDLVFFNTMRRTFSHVGIYLGDDKFIHAPRTGALVRIDDMSQSYWAQRFTGARRADPVTASTTLPSVR
jgi:cell wall-associated NlpC family hydrolase